MRRYGLLILSAVALAVTTAAMVITRNAVITIAGSLITIGLVAVWLLRRRFPSSSNFTLPDSSGADERLATAGTRSRGKLHLDVSADDARRATKDAIDSLDHYRLQAESDESLVVRIEAGWSTWGELLHITYHEVEVGVDIQVDTEQVQATTRIDFGQARRDVERLLKATRYFASPRETRPG